jgi:glutamate-1-semialdehyde 2,1-aminomutase
MPEPLAPTPVTGRRPQERSLALFRRLERLLPGGNTRTTTFYAPFPIAVARGDGALVWDADGNRYIDLLGNYTALIHGQAHPAIGEAVSAAFRSGSAHPAPIELQAALAERIAARVPSIERLRFTNSGNEAVMMAVRAARAFTGRDAIVKAVGGYHGSWEQVATASSEDEADPGRAAPGGEPGIPRAVAGLAHPVSYNDVEGLTETMQVHGDQVAAIILEPVLGHIIEPATTAFLQAARSLADAHGALLILDEVITLRLHVGGAQALHGVNPDLTTLGKIIGGGLPVGAFGGRADVMDQFDPRRAGHVDHHGTFNGNALTMAAGGASLDLLPQSEIDRIGALGARLADGALQAVRDAGLSLDSSRVGSLVNLRGPLDLLLAMHAAALDEGVYMAPRGLLCVSTPMDDAILDEVLGSLQRAALRVAESARGTGE